MRGKFDMDDYISEDYDYEFSRVVSDSEEFSYEDGDYEPTEEAEMQEWERWYDREVSNADF